MGLISEMLSGNQRSLSKLITLVENNVEIRNEIIKKIHSHTGNAHIIGFTGPPGVGKSTLVNKVISELLTRGKSVGVVAIDPSSPFSKGAVLGDRIRMLGNEEDNNLFIRSLASRGKLGGLSKATNDVVKLMDAFGKDTILIETVGIGQSEYDIAKSAHTTVIVLSPGNGDEVQAMKAGVLETGEIFVVNKADTNGVHQTLLELRGTIELNFPHNKWRPPVMKVSAMKDEGVSELTDQLLLHYDHLRTENELEKVDKLRIENDLEDLIREWTEKVLLKRLHLSDKKEHYLEEIYQKKGDPTTIIEDFLNEEMSPINNK